MDTEKISADVGTVIFGASGLALWHFAQIGLGVFMLVGGACLLTFRFYIAYKENKLLNIQLERAKK